MREDMIRWGAVDKECPVCHQQTPIYPNTIFGGNTSVPCLSCGVSLQYKGDKAVIAEYGVASQKDILEAEERELNNIAQIAHYRLGIPRHELHQDLRKRLPKETLSGKIKRILLLP